MTWQENKQRYLYARRTRGIVLMNGRAGMQGIRLRALADAKVELDIPHQAGVTVGESQVADVGPFALCKLAVARINHLEERKGF